MADGTAGMAPAGGEPVPNSGSGGSEPERVIGKELPHNIEAEQALLGAILVNNDVVDKVAFLEPSHFYDPVHRRIYEQLKRRVAQGKLATAVTMKTLMEADEGLKELGGTDYLGRLSKSAITIFNAKDYAQTVYELAMRRSLAEVGETISVRALDTSDDVKPEEQITDAEMKLYQLAEQGQVEGGFVTFKHALLEAVETANAAYQRDGGLAGMSTGLMEMDKKMGGLHPSDLLIIAGRPSMGKTALVTNIAFNIAKAYERGVKADGKEGTINGGVVGFFSLEMSAEQLATRILAEQAEVASEKIRKGDMDEDEFQ
ncbi:MAG: DnaB-like helicase C-terminal domain-containing protein, partial [Pseudomonadota bacterium]